MSPIAPPPVFNFAQYLLERNADRGGQAAYIDDSETMSYAVLHDRIRRVSGGLTASGLQAGERVLLLMHDCNDWPVAFLGALHAGVVPVAVNTLLTADDYAYMLSHSEARVVLVSAALLPVLELALAKGAHSVEQIYVSQAGAAPPGSSTSAFSTLLAAPPAAQAAATRSDAPAFWLYSSGSTGRPKGAVHTHAGLYWTAALYAGPVLGMHEGDVVFSAAKLFFAYGLGNALTFPLNQGATVVLMAGRPTPEACFDRILRHRPTVFCGAPTGYAGLLASPALPGSESVALRLCSSAGEALPRDIGERFTAHFGCEIIDGIGSTEMLHIFLSNRPGDVRYGTTGKPVDGYRLELRGEDGGPVADGEIGDLFIEGPSAALMYWDNPEKTRDTFQGNWTRSGDKYSRDAEGYYTYAGRSDDMLKVSGQYVSPFEVEGTLVQHPAVLEAAVIGALNADGLQRARAYVVLKAGLEAGTPDMEATLKAFVKERLAPYKYPREIVFVAELPKTATGKIQRFRLREAAAVPAPNCAALGAAA